MFMSNYISMKYNRKESSVHGLNIKTHFVFTFTKLFMTINHTCTFIYRYILFIYRIAVI